MMHINDIGIIRQANQQITKPVLETPQAVIEYMGVIQAQDYNMAKLAVGARSLHATHQQIENDINEGKIIRTHILRPTWHLISVNDVRWVMELTAPGINKILSSMYRQMELDDKIFKKSNAIIHKLLSNTEALTRKEIMTELEKAGIKTDSLRAVHIMFKAETEMIACNGAKRNKQFTYSLFDRKVPAAKSIPRDEALAKLASRYFTSHGPATIKDFSWWSGLSAADAKKAVALVKNNFNSEAVNSETYWFVDANREKAVAETDIFLMPSYDEFTVGYTDRGALIESTSRSKINTKNLIFSPIIIRNGKVIGTWKKSIKGKEVNIETMLFRRMLKSEKGKLQKAIDFVRNFYNEF